MVNPNQIASRNANSSRLVNSDSYTISNVNEHKTKELPLRPTIVWSSEQSKYSENITESSAFSYQNENTKTLLLENKTKELDINHMVNGTADEGTKTLLLNNPSTQLKNSKSTTNRSEVSRGVNDSLFRRIFMHLFENNQFSIKYDQEVFVKSNKRVARGFEILRTQSEIDRTIQFNSNNISRKVYGFLAECFLCLIPKDIRDERGSYYCYLNCIANHFKIENYKFNKEKLRNICRMRERNLKKTNTRLESPEETEIKATVMNLKKLTNTIDFSLMFIGDLNQFNLLKTQLDTLLIVYKDTLSPKIINMVPAIENIENAMLIMTTYAISLDPGLNSVNGNEKFYKVVNAIFDHYNMSSPCNLVKTVTAASNGIYKEISNSNTCYIFFLGTVPIYTEQNYYEAILKWIKCNIISKQLRMNDPHRNLFQMILELSNASKSRIVKGRSEPSQLISAITTQIRSTLNI